MDEVDPLGELGDEAYRVFPHYEFNDLKPGYRCRADATPLPVEAWTSCLVPTSSFVSVSASQAETVASGRQYCT